VLPIRDNVPDNHHLRDGWQGKRADVAASATDFS